MGESRTVNNPRALARTLRFWWHGFTNLFWNSVLVECCGAVGQFDHAQGNRVKDVALSIANDQVDCPKYESLEMNDHLRYEELTALAAAGYLSDEECQDLLKHFASCEQCRNSGRAFRDIVRCLWPTRDKLHELIDNWEDDEAVRARFIERVRQEGIKLSRDIPPRKRSRD